MIGFEAEIARIIQLSVAPVFLIVGIGGILSVLINRLKLIYRRYRRLQQSIEKAGRVCAPKEIEDLRMLDRRMIFIHWSITLSTMAMLLVCIVIVSLFTEEFIRIDFSEVVAALFIAAMVMLTLALIFFLFEIRLATKMLRVPKEFLLEISNAAEGADSVKAQK